MRMYLPLSLEFVTEISLAHLAMVKLEDYDEERGRMIGEFFAMENLVTTVKSKEKNRLTTKWKSKADRRIVNLFKTHNGLKKSAEEHECLPVIIGRIMLNILRPART